MSSVALVENVSSPDTPSAGQIVLYPKTDGTFYYKDDAGVEYRVLFVNPATISDGKILIGEEGVGFSQGSIISDDASINVTYENGNINIESAGGEGSGSVTSVAIAVPTGLSVSGSPITTSGTITISLAAGYAIPTTAKQGEWDSAYSNMLKWDGGSSGLNASTGRTSLGATGVGSNIFTLTNPDAISFLRINADNSVSALNATDFKTALGVPTGTVTSVTGTGTVNGISLSGTVTSSGNITLGGTLSGVDLATQTTGVLASTRGGTGNNNAGSISLAGDLTISGNHTLTITLSGNTSITLPTSGTIASLGVEGQTLTGGAIVSSKDLGTVSSGTVTPSPGNRPIQHYTNNGAHTFAASSNVGTCFVQVTNGASAGAITFSGFDLIEGQSELVTTNGAVFILNVIILGSFKIVQIKKKP